MKRYVVACFVWDDEKRDYEYHELGSVRSEEYARQLFDRITPDEIIPQVEIWLRDTEADDDERIALKDSYIERRTK